MRSSRDVIERALSLAKGDKSVAWEEALLEEDNSRRSRWSFEEKSEVTPVWPESESGKNR